MKCIGCNDGAGKREGQVVYICTSFYFHISISRGPRDSAADSDQGTSAEMQLPALLVWSGYLYIILERVSLSVRKSHGRSTRIDMVTCISSMHSPAGRPPRSCQPM